GVPASFCGAPDSDRFRLPPLVPSGLVVPAYGSCTVVVLVFSAIAPGNTSSARSVGLFRVNPARYDVVPLVLTVTAVAALTADCPRESVAIAVIWCDPLNVGTNQSCGFHVIEYGAAVTGAPTRTPSTRNATLDTVLVPAADAVADSVT